MGQEASSILTNKCSWGKRPREVRVFYDRAGTIKKAPRSRSLFRTYAFRYSPTHANGPANEAGSQDDPVNGNPAAATC